MTASKLPEWPEWPELPSTPGEYPADEWHNYWIDKAEAALARMEALKAEVIDLRDMADDRISGADRRRIDELLAACERGEG